MKTVNIINKLKRLGIYLFLYGGSLKYRAPQKTMTDGIITLLRQHKQSLCTLLRVGNPYNLPLVVKQPIRASIGSDYLLDIISIMLGYISSLQGVVQQASELGSSIQIVNADFYPWCNENLEHGSVDLILTDPPYPKKYLHRWDQLGEIAANVLKPGGYLVSYSGLYHLPTVIEALNRHLTYIWVIALHHKGKTQLVFPSNVISTYKPILIFGKGEIRKFNKTIPDSITSNKRDKRYHKWGQSEDGVTKLMETFSERNDLVLDPFVGGGTTLAAAKKLGRRCIGTEIDPNLIDVIKKRLKNTETKVCAQNA